MKKLAQWFRDVTRTSFMWHFNDLAPATPAPVRREVVQFAKPTLSVDVSSQPRPMKTARQWKPAPKPHAGQVRVPHRVGAR